MDASPSYVITPELEHAMARDLAAYLRRRWYTMALIVSAPALLCILVLSVASDADPVGALIPLLIIGAGVGACALWYGRLARRAIALSYPAGTVVGARVTPDSLYFSNALGSRESFFFAFSRVRVAQDTLILLNRGSGGSVGFLPRGAISEPELALLHEKVASAANALR